MPRFSSIFLPFLVNQTQTQTQQQIFLVKNTCRDFLAFSCPSLSTKHKHKTSNRSSLSTKHKNNTNPNISKNTNTNPATNFSCQPNTNPNIGKNTNINPAIHLQKTCVLDSAPYSRIFYKTQLQVPHLWVCKNVAIGDLKRSYRPWFGLRF